MRLGQKNGSWSLSFGLVKPDSYSYHKIYASIKSDAHGVDMKTETAQLIYSQDYAEVEKLIMVNTAHDASKREFVTDFDFQKFDAPVPSYNYQPQYPTFTIKAEFGGDASLVSDVYVATVGNSGKKTYVKCAYDNITGAWIGSHDYTDFLDAPCSVSVKYYFKGKEIEDEYLSMLNGMAGREFEDTYADWDEMTDSVLDGTLYYGAGHAEVPIRIEKEPGGLSDYDLIGFQEKGYEEILRQDGMVGLVNEKSNSVVYLFDVDHTDTLKAEIGMENLAADSFLLDDGSGAGRLRAASRNRPQGALCTKCNDITLPDLVHLGKKAAEELEETDSRRASQIISTVRRVRLLLIVSMGIVIVTYGSYCEPDSIVASLITYAHSDIDMAENYLGACMKVILQELEKLLREAYGYQRTGSEEYLYLYECDGQEGCDCGGELCNCSGEGDGDGGEREPGPTRSSESPEKTANKILDPSGYVYEAVPSNRVEGVKAEIYYYDYAEDEFGVLKDTKEEILWDAENYGQETPLYTDVDGVFAWDVPQGQWTVKFSKDGYDPADSYKDAAADEEGYLTVPPIQTEVNTAIVSKAAPEAESIIAY